MAKSNQKNQNVTDILLEDHKTIIKLFDKIAENDNPEEISDLFFELHEALEIHTKLEEEFFYPVLEAATQDIQEPLKALQEHAILKNMLNELKVMDFAQEYEEVWTAKLQILREMFEHHITEEQDEMFPRMREEMNEKDLEDLGKEIQQIKEQLQS
jgi:hemerythrin superfamily protein